jgi:hypothetical protein
MFQAILVTFTDTSLSQQQSINFPYASSEIIPFLKGLALVSNNELFGYF